MNAQIPESPLVPESPLAIFEHHWSVEIIAVITFLVVYESLSRFVHLLIDRWTARKYNISGEYIAYYDDQSGQNKIKQYSHLKLTQRGIKVFGKNVSIASNNDNRRTWSLEGKLFHGHLISGSYKEISHRDSRSVGSFFVAQMEGTMDFKGFWAGWDETNHKLSVGEYIFIRRVTELYFDKFIQTDRPRIAKLSEQAFGHGYFETGIENRLTLYKDTAQLLVARNSDSNNIVGFSLFYMLPKQGLNKFLNIDDKSDNPIDTIDVESKTADDIRESDKTGKIGVIQTICVSDEMRHRGVGQDFLEYTEKQIKRLFPTVILAPAWNIRLC